MTPFSEVLAAILPAPEDRLLLRACLKAGESGCQACESWLKRHAASQNELRKDSSKALLPLLLRAVRTHGIDVDADFRTVLRTAAMREELRTNAYRSICRDVFSCFAANEIPMIVLGGSALAETVYPDPAARHSHDIDILIPEEEMARAARLLSPLGFRAITPPQSEMHHRKFEHESTVPLRLHSRLFQLPHCDVPMTQIWARSPSCVVADVAARRLSPADSLLYVCGHASYSNSRQSLRWVSDAWFIIARHPDLDWDHFLDCARLSRLALPLSVMIDYLAKDLGAAIPSSFSDRLHAAASRTDATGLEFALWGLLAQRRGGLAKVMWSGRDWHTRASLLKFLLLPSPSYLRWAEHLHHSWMLPLYYVYRPMRYITRCIRWRYKQPHPA